MPKITSAALGSLNKALLIDRRAHASSDPTYVSAVSPALGPEAQAVIDDFVAHTKAAAARVTLGLASSKAPGLEGLLARHFDRLALAKRKPKSLVKAQAWAQSLISGPADLRAQELGKLASVDLKAPNALDNLSPLTKEGAKAILAVAQSSGAAALRDLGAPSPAAAPIADLLITSPKLEFLLDWVVCDDLTGVGAQELNADEILLGGQVIYANGWTESFNLGKIGTFDHTGQDLDFTPDKVLARFDAAVGAGGSACAVLISLVEQDYGSFPDWLNDARHYVMKILAYLIGGDTGPEDSFVDTPEAWTRFVLGLGLAAIGGPLGFLSLLATAIVAAIFNAVRDAWDDDVIGTQSFVLTRPETISTFRSGSSYERLTADFIGSAAHYRVRGSWHLLADGVVDHFRAGPLDIVKVVKESARASHPRVEVMMPPGYKVIGGGACANWGGDWAPAGSLITEAYPSSPSSWAAASKDHWVAHPCTVTAVAYGVKANGKEIGGDDHQIKMVQSPRDHKVSAAAVCDGDFTVIGGGARVRYEEPGSLLTSSYFDGKYWRATAQDHVGASFSTLEAYAVGIRTSVLRGMRIHALTATSRPAGIVPTAIAPVPDEMVILSGGGSTQTAGPGLLLTGLSAGENRFWTASAKDHQLSSPGTARAHILAARIDGGADLPAQLGAASARVQLRAPAPRTGRRADGSEIVLVSGTVTRSATLYPSLDRPSGYKLRWSRQARVASDVSATENVDATPLGAPDHLTINIALEGPADFDVTYAVWWERA